MSKMVSLDGLDAFAHRFWQETGLANVFLFYGEMGAGKTTLIEALCAAKGVHDRTSSPTFSIINEYQYSEEGHPKVIYHMDLYRLKEEEEIIRAGVEDCLYSGAICMVEWPERAPALFDDTAMEVHIEVVDETRRRIKLIPPAGRVAEEL